jgi:translocation and assembly module TamA
LGNLVNTAPRSAPFYTLTATLEQPHFLARDLRLNTQLETSSNIEQAYQYIGGDARVRLIWQPHPQFVLRTSYNFEAYRLWGVSTLVGFNGQSAAPLLTYGCTSTPCNQFLSYLEEAVEWDRRDNGLHPRRGYYLALSIQEGGGPLGGSYTYLRILPEARYYQPIGSRWTLAGRVKAGTLIPLSNQPSPIVARFFAGGAVSMRGFGTNRLSPLQAVANPSNVTSPSTLASPFGTVPGYTYGEIPGSTAPIGGNGLFEASLELRYDITHNFVFSIFADSGMVTQESFGGWAHTNQPDTAPALSPYFRNMQYALGFGFRYLTPVGPIRVDLAYRLNVGPPLEVVQPTGPTVFYPTQGTCFGLFDNGAHHIAGAPEGPCAFHISFGEAF